MDASLLKGAVATSAGGLDQFIDVARRAVGRVLNRVQAKLREVSARQEAAPVTINGWTAGDGVSAEMLQRLADAGALAKADELFTKIDADEDLGPTEPIDDFIARWTPTLATR